MKLNKPVFVFLALVVLGSVAVTAQSNGGIDRQFKQSGSEIEVTLNNLGDDYSFEMEKKIAMGDVVGVKLDRVRILGSDQRSFTLDIKLLEPEEFDKDGVAAMSRAVFKPKGAKNDEVNELRYEFEVSKDKNPNATKDNVVVYRKKSSSWTEINSTFLEKTNTGLKFRADSSMYGDFVIGSEKPQFEITSAELAGGTVGVNKEFGINLDVRNVGLRDGNYDVEVTSGEGVITRDSISVPAKTNKTAKLTGSIGEIGVYEISVNNYSVGKVRVEGGGGEAETDGGSGATGANGTNGSTDSGGGGDKGGNGQPGFGFAVSVTALLAVLYFRAR
ncbi:MAG: hypothetical protein ABEK59_12950 [Halobacteria archaeon]